METQKFKVGDPVEFNIGKKDGPVGFGHVIRVNPNGSFIVQPQGGQMGNNSALFNIKPRRTQ